MLYYIPTPDGAPASIQTITFLVPFSALVRNMHYLAGQLLVVVTAIHLLRVIFTGALVRVEK
jgi:quinol-cytochrome oxidoreductase complex cytochrome b subunit